MIKKSVFLFPMTMFVIGVTSVVTILQFVYPEILSLLSRNPVALAEGEWWRLITPMLVHADGWWQYIFNIICIFIVGIEIERSFGKMKFLILYLSGGLVGEIAGYVWEPYGAGASVGLCGLLGALFFVMIRGKANHRSIISLLSLYIVVGFVGFASDSMYVIIGLFVATFILMAILRRQNLRDQSLDILFGSLGLLGGMVLLFLYDIHGAAILGGLCAMFILQFIHRFYGLQNKA